ncbi:uncharacterized protein EI97DRAFT_295516 [Westerdykella ornata]|uniref:SMP domain-containing protein n=1 Tax=Westerdykella ornata TaxID=318751 RepID=A0A6A6JLY0_WESOR|nr:uncharacterized protein EI97DRAFT_295516 [Westerdykella ornata]KAF2277512.1 hypothetical protein EI97DRAFT_295516 [Westerdykella ornata]
MAITGQRPEADNAQNVLHDVIEKLKMDPTSITPDDARRLHEHFTAIDPSTARIIAAVEANPASHDDIAAATGTTEALSKAVHTSLHTIVQDLVSAVDKNPNDVTDEILRLTQVALSRMRSALGIANAPHPELEPELHEEMAKIAPKVKQGTVTKAEADHLHSLEARAHGHTEKGGLTAAAQSIAAKRDRRQSISSGSNDQAASDIRGLDAQEQSHRDRQENLDKVEAVLRPKIENEPEHVTKEDAAVLVSREQRAHNVVHKGSLAAQAQSLADRNENLHPAKAEICGKGVDKITKADAAMPQSRETRAPGTHEEGCHASPIQSIADKKEGHGAVPAQ